MKKKILAIGLSSAILTSQALFANTESMAISAVKTGDHNTNISLDQWASALPTQLSAEENLAIDQLESALQQLISSGFLAEGSEGEQLVTLIEELIESIRARNAGEIFEKGREILILVGQVASNREIDIQTGLDSIGRLVEAIQAKDTKAAAAAITDIALIIARLAKILNG